MNPQNFEHACDLMHDKLHNKEHLWVQRFLQVTAPQRLPSRVLSAMVLYDYPIENLMARFTPPDCATALATAVINNKIEACAFLLEFVTDDVKGLKLSSLALRAAKRNHLEILDVLSQDMSERDKVWVLIHICSRLEKDHQSLKHIHVGEILLKDLHTPKLLDLVHSHGIREPSAPFLQVCEHMLSLNQKNLLEGEVENVGQPNTKRKI